MITKCIDVELYIYTTDVVSCFRVSLTLIFNVFLFYLKSLSMKTHDAIVCLQISNNKSTNEQYHFKIIVSKMQGQTTLT